MYPHAGSLPSVLHQGCGSVPVSLTGIMRSERKERKMKMNQNKTANLSTEEMKKEIIDSIEKMNEESLESFYKFVITIKDFSKLQLEYLEKIADPGTMEFDDYMEAVEKVAQTTDEEIIRLMDDIN